MQSRWCLSAVFQGETVGCPGRRTQDTGPRWKITNQRMKGCQGDGRTAAFVRLASFLNSKSLAYTFPLVKRLA